MLLPGVLASKWIEKMSFFNLFDNPIPAKVIDSTTRLKIVNKQNFARNNFLSIIEVFIYTLKDNNRLTIVLSGCEARDKSIF
jgi:hypothetical protein